MNLFAFLDDILNYESRKLGRDGFDWGVVSTCRVSDGSQPFETAVEHTDYNDGKLVAVEAYDSEMAAICGHQRWVERMTAAQLPDSLMECRNAVLAQLAYASNQVYQSRSHGHHSAKS